MGKTSIARELGRRLCGENWRFIFIDVEEAATVEDVIARFSKLVSDANERVDAILNILEHDGYLEHNWTGGGSSFRPVGSGTIGASGTARPDYCIPAEVAEEYGMSQPTSAPTIRKFNPGAFQSDQEVKEQFVVRNRELDVVSGMVKRNLASESCQHALIVAPRGMGKTMLLTRMEAELRLDSDLAPDLIPVRFMEESYEVADLTGFWLEVLFQLGRECSRQGLDAGAELEAAHASFCARWRDTHLRLEVLAAIERGLASIDRRMVLMVENLQALSETWHSDDEWGLRRVLQTVPEIMLIGTATTRFKSLEDADRAFFDLFRLVELGPLTAKECAALWNMATRQNLAAREIRPFEILTGGSPRLLVLLAGVGHQLTLRQLLADMVGLIDEHTEYFRQCLESLPSSERRVFLALADLWEPALASVIADRARMDIRTTSVMLRRLTDKGAVSASATRRSRRYTVTRGCSVSTTACGGSETSLRSFEGSLRSWWRSTIRRPQRRSSPIWTTVPM
ncbi:MAG: AAA family ATPase [Caldilineaceae bacterium]|nr:AAA family ATPase [Caldilineaceae bacterium]